MNKNNNKNNNFFGFFSTMSRSGFSVKSSSTKSHFSKSQQAKLPRSKFDLSHGHKTTFDAGKLVPIFMSEVYPGDTFDVKLTALVRFATLLKPLMDNVFLDTHFFYVPNRLLWDNWKKFQGEQRNPGDSVDYLIPTITFPGGPPPYPLTSGFWSLIDNFGLPISPTLIYGGNTTISCLPLRAVNLIYNEFFRDENLQDSLPNNFDDGPDDFSDYDNILYRGKRHDYFTSCLPFPQKGPGVELPLGGFAPVVSDGTSPTTQAINGGPVSGPMIWDNTVNINSYKPSTSFPSTITPLKWSNSGLQADLSSATPITINDLRYAIQFQKLLERDARGGTRYPEILLSHWGVHASDASLQRPQYLGGTSQMLNVSPVVQTSISAGETPQGNLAGFALSVINKHIFTRFFEEHGVVIGFISARSSMSYQNGIDRFWTRRTRLDFYMPVLRNLGEQAVLNREIFFQNNATDLDVFGYQEIWSELRTKQSLITGKFRSSDPQSIDFYHLAQDFSTLPTLSPEFIIENPPIDRVIATPEEPHFLMDALFTFYATRELSTYGTPGLMDHF